MGRQRGLAPAVAVLVAAVAVAGCWGDPGYSFAIRNESDRELIVAFEGRRVEVSAGAAGIFAQSLGVATGDIAIMDETCSRLATVPVTTQLGVVVVSEDGSATLESLAEGATLPRGSLGETDRCHDPLFVPSPGVVGSPAYGAGTILFRAMDGLWTIQADGSRLTQLVGDGRSVQEAVWSPDGTKIAFVEFRPGDATDVLLLDAESGTETTLIEDAWAPAWSPDGTELAVVLGAPADERGALGRIDREGGEVREIADEAGPPVWSPDGRYIAWVIPGTEFYASGTLFVALSDGSDVRELRPDPAGVAYAEWSPDGLLMVDIPAGDGSETRLLDIADGSTERLLPDSLVGGSASWSPDGAQLLFHGRNREDDAAQATIRILDQATGDVRAVVEPSEFEADVGPAWSSSGDRILFTRSTFDEFGDLYVVRADGTGLVRLAEGVDRPQWRPGG